MSRARDLLRLAAEALEDGRDPLSQAFLVEHQVTLDECYNLADAMAAAIRRFAALPAAPAGLDAAWARAEAALPPGGRLTAIFETWGADMHRLGHRGLVRGREDAVAALDDLARISTAAYAATDPDAKEAGGR